MLRRNKRKIPKVLNQKSAKALLEAHGWTAGVGGKHQVKMTKPECRPITLPENKRGDYPPGLRAAILREARLLDQDSQGRGRG